MRFPVRSLVYIALFGALWGASEIGLGSLLHVVNLPFTGAIMAAMGMAIALVGRVFVPSRGSVLAIGLVAAFLKLLSVGGNVLNPAIGIVAESLLAEAVVSALGPPRRAPFVVAGALAVFWALLHPFLTQGLLAGQGIVVVYGWTLSKGAALLGLPPSAALVIVGALVAVHLLLGACGGLLAWDVGQMVRRRLLPREAP